MGYHHGKFHDSSICQFGYLRGGGRNPPPPAQLTPQKLGMNRVKVWILYEKIDKYRKYQINSTLGEVVTDS